MGDEGRRTAPALQWAVDGPPVGVWVTSLGSADTLVRETLHLRADGTGDLRSRSVMMGEATMPVVWRHEGPGVLHLAQLEPGDDPDDPPWERVTYAATVVATDTSDAVAVLRNTDAAGVPVEGFWTLAGPITPRSPAD